MNGTSSNEIMIIDSDDEQEAVQSAKPYMDNSVYEEEDEEYDTYRPLKPIVQRLDLPLGCEVLHLSFINLASEVHRTAWATLPKLLSSNIVIAIACSDSSVRVLSIPITPPSPQNLARPNLNSRITVPQAGRGLFGEQIVILSGAAGHQSLPKGISITLTSQMLQSMEDVDMADDDRGEPQSQAWNSSRSSRSRSRPASRESSWEFLIASHSDDLSGILVIHRMPFTGDTIGGSGPQEPNTPWRIQCLASPATSISFNSSLFPAPRHSRLVVVELQGAVRIFDCKPQSELDQGSWLFSLYPSFQSFIVGTPRRKQILDVQWVLGGQAIAVLLADGEWGVWDIENAGPKGNSEIKRSPSRGASLAFTISSWAGSTPVTQSSMKSSSAGRKENKSRLAPMTPGTRKVRREALFSGSSTTLSTQTDRPSRGGLSVSPIYRSSSSKVNDESLLLWYNESIMVIPSLFTYWQNKAKGSGNLFGTGARAQPKEYNIHLGGQLRNHVSLLPQHAAKIGGESNAAITSEILITGERRLVIVGPPLKPPVPAPAVSLQVLSKPIDQHLLVQGELDVDGMDRILDGMSNGHGERFRNGTTSKRKVDFLAL